MYDTVRRQVTNLLAHALRANRPFTAAGKLGHRDLQAAANLLPAIT